MSRRARPSTSLLTLSRLHGHQMAATRKDLPLELVTSDISSIHDRGNSIDGTILPSRRDAEDSRKRVTKLDHPQTLHRPSGGVTPSHRPDVTHLFCRTLAAYS